MRWRMRQGQCSRPAMVGLAHNWSGPYRLSELTCYYMLYSTEMGESERYRWKEDRCTEGPLAKNLMAIIRVTNLNEYNYI